MTEQDGREGPHSVWLIGSDAPMFKTIVAETEEAAQDVLDSVDRDVAAGKVEFVPDGELPEWADFSETIRNYEREGWEAFQERIEEEVDDG